VSDPLRNLSACVLALLLPILTAAVGTAQTFVDVSPLEGVRIVNETISDNPAVQAVPFPLTWNTAVTDDFRFDCFTVCVETGLWGGEPEDRVERSAGSGAVPVSPSVCVHAGHVPGSGEDYVWMDAGGNEIHRSRVWSGHLPGATHSDYSVLILNEPLPASIKPVKILSDISAISGEQVAALGHDRRVMVCELGYTLIDPFPPTNASDAMIINRSPLASPQIGGGDSGKPGFVFIEGDPGEPAEPCLAMTAFALGGYAGAAPNTRNYGSGPCPSNTAALAALRTLVESRGEELDIVIVESQQPPEPEPLPPGDYGLRTDNNKTLTVGGVPLIRGVEE
jgi:hypothetical protein